MERMSKPKFIKEIEKSEGKERAKCGRWYIRVYGELDHKPMVELESLEMVVKELHKLEEENKELDEAHQIARDRVIELQGNIELYLEHIKELEEENRKLKEDLENMRDYCSNLDSENDEQALEIEDLKREIEKLKETIKDHQLYEEKLEHRIIEFEELLHGE